MSVQTRVLLFATAAFAALLNALDLFVPPLGIPLAILFIWLVLRNRGEGWGSLGLARPESWMRTIGLGMSVAFALQAFAVFVLLPGLGAIGIDPPDLSRFEAIRGSLPLLLLYLTISWTTAGFGEEIVWRGFILGRLAQGFGGGKGSWVFSLLFTSVVFGLLHAYQGVVGMALTGVAGLVLGSLYLLSGRNLWASIIAHAVTDTLSFVLIYTGLFERLF